MHVAVDIDAFRRKASFERNSHPADAGDLVVVVEMLDGTYRDAREWLVQEIARSGRPVPQSEADLLREQLADMAAERDRYREHSVTLNAIAWRIASVLGDVPAGAEEITGDPVEQVERLIAELADARRTASQGKEPTMPNRRPYGPPEMPWWFKVLFPLSLLVGLGVLGVMVWAVITLVNYVAG